MRCATRALVLLCLAACGVTDGMTCRDFLASYVRNGAESWLQGEACRGGPGPWEVRHMKPWRRTWGVRVRIPRPARKPFAQRKTSVSPRA